MEAKIFVKHIDNEGVQVITILNGKMYVDILDKEEFEELYQQESYILCNNNNYYVMEMIGTDDIDKKRSMMNKVVKEEIVEVAKKVYMDTIFCLEGVADEKS